MELNEAFLRIVRAHRLLIVVTVVLACAIAGGLVMFTKATYASTARIQASTSLLGSDTEADSVLNRVNGIATSATIVQKALDAAQVRDRSATTIAQHDVTTARLGSSAVFDLTVVDADAATAQAVSAALANQVVTFLNNGSQQVRQLVDQLNQQETALRTQREQTAASLALAKTPVDSANAAATLAGQDQELTDLATTVRQLEIALATNGEAAVVTPGAPAVQVARTNPTTDVGIAAAIGLVAALLLASVVELVRPKAPTARVVASDLGAPLLDARHEALLALELQNIAERAGVRSVVVTADGPERTAGARARLSEILDRRWSGPAANGTDHDATALLLADAVPTAHVGNGHRRVPVPARPLAEANGAEVATATSLRSTPRRSGRRLSVSALSDASLPGDRPGIVVVVAPPVAYRFVHTTADLAASTGWPVLAVVEARALQSLVGGDDA